MNLFQKFAISAQKRAQKELASDVNGSLSYQGALEQSMAIASALCSRYEEDTHIAFMLPNIKEIFPIVFGTLRANMVTVPVNYLLKPEEILNILVHGQVRLLITRKEWGEPILKVVQSKGLPLDVLFVDESSGELSFSGFAASALDQIANLPELLTDSERMALLLFTSGTTGTPKGVMLSHGNIDHNVVHGTARIGVTESDRLLGVLPYFHTFALTVNLFIVAIEGMSISMMIRFVPKEFFKLLRVDQVSIAAMVPSMYKVLLRSKATAQDLASIRLFISGGEALTRPVGLAFYERFGQVIAEGYGLTETAPIISVNNDLVPDKIGCVGKPLEQTRVFILDENGNRLKQGEVGMIGIQSPSVMLGYFNNPEETEKLWVGDIFTTGDLGYLDEDGAIRISGREKDLIISAGENIYPIEIEELATTFPGIEECAAVGVPCSLKGESVLLAVSGNLEDDKGLKSFLKEKLPRYKQPKEYMILDELPKNQLGKIVKSKIASLFSQS